MNCPRRDDGWGGEWRADPHPQGGGVIAAQMTGPKPSFVEYTILGEMNSSINLYHFQHKEWISVCQD